MEDLLKAYKNLVTQLILNPARKVKEYKLLSEEMETEIVESVNEAYYKYEKGTFQEGFLKAARELWNKMALIDDTRKVTYEELLNLSKNVAVVLKSARRKSRRSDCNRCGRQYGFCDLYHGYFDGSGDGVSAD